MKHFLGVRTRVQVAPDESEQSSFIAAIQHIKCRHVALLPEPGVQGLVGLLVERRHRRRRKSNTARGKRFRGARRSVTQFVTEGVVLDPVAAFVHGRDARPVPDTPARSGRCVVLRAAGLAAGGDAWYCVRAAAGAWSTQAWAQVAPLQRITQLRILAAKLGGSGRAAGLELAAPGRPSAGRRRAARCQPVGPPGAGGAARRPAGAAAAGPPVPPRAARAIRPPASSVDARGGSSLEQAAAIRALASSKHWTAVLRRVQRIGRLQHRLPRGKPRRRADAASGPALGCGPGLSAGRDGSQLSAHEDLQVPASGAPVVGAGPDRTSIRTND